MLQLSKVDSASSQEKKKKDKTLNIEPKFLY